MGSGFTLRLHIHLMQAVGSDHTGTIVSGAMNCYPSMRCTCSSKHEIGAVSSDLHVEKHQEVYGVVHLVTTE